MKLNRFKFVLFLVLSIGGIGHAADTKIAVFDIQKVVNEVQDGKSATTEMEKAYQSRKTEVDKKKKELQNLVENYKRQAMVLKKSELAAKQKEIEEKQMDLEKAGRTAENDLRKKELDLREKITQKITTVVESLAKSGKIDLIIEKDSAGAVYVKPDLDMTDKVIAEYNKAYHKK